MKTRSIWPGAKGAAMVGQVQAHAQWFRQTETLAERTLP
jgi:hypothetical protein